jgi:hypothetical protein
VIGVDGALVVAPAGALDAHDAVVFAFFLVQVAVEVAEDGGNGNGGPFARPAAVGPVVDVRMIGDLGVERVFHVFGRQLREGLPEVRRPVLQNVGPHPVGHVREPVAHQLGLVEHEGGDGGAAVGGRNRHEDVDHLVPAQGGDQVAGVQAAH